MTRDRLGIGSRPPESGSIDRASSWWTTWERSIGSGERPRRRDAAGIGGFGLSVGLLAGAAPVQAAGRTAETTEVDHHECVAAGHQLGPVDEVLEAVRRAGRAGGIIGGVLDGSGGPTWPEWLKYGPIETMTGVLA